MVDEVVVRNDEVAWDDSRAAGWTDKDGCGRPHEEEGEELWEEVPRRSGSEHRIVTVKWVDTNKVTVKSYKYDATSWQRTSEAQTRTGRIFSRPLCCGS